MIEAEESFMLRAGGSLNKNKTAMCYSVVSQVGRLLKDPSVLTSSLLTTLCVSHCSDFVASALWGSIMFSGGLL